MREAAHRRYWRGGAAGVVAIAALLLALPGRVSAHALAPALLELVETDAATYEVLWRRSYEGIPGVVMEPDLPTRCRPIAAAVDEPGDVTIDTRWRVDCGPQGVRGGWIGVAGIEETDTDALVRVEYRDGTATLGVVRAGAPRLELPLEPEAIRVAADYLRLGVRHILFGFDHLLLVLCLLWLIPNLRMLLIVLTSFTVGHTVTLVLALAAVTPLPQAPIEAAVAASVLLLAVEAASSTPSRWIGTRPWIAAGAFGLLHGVGFAGALRDIGLPASQVPLALLSFNAGIELGQIVFVTFALACVAVARRLPLPEWSHSGPVFVAGSLAAMWTIERTIALF